MNEKKLVKRLDEITIESTDKGWNYEGYREYREEFAMKYGKDWQEMTLFDLCIKGDNYAR
jgi:hypothetical protein